MFKFLLRFIKFLSVFLLICVPVMILGAILLLIFLPISHNRYPITLPFLLRWFDCADFYVGRDTSTYRKVVSLGWFSRYTWLAFRNPMNYFDYQYLGLKIKKPIQYLLYNPEESKVDNNKKEGLRHIELLNGDNKQYFEYFYIKKIPFWPTKCIRFRMGWKIKDNDHKEYDILQFCLVFNPFHPYTGV